MFVVLFADVIPAFSSPAFFLVPHFHVSHFQSPRFFETIFPVMSRADHILRAVLSAKKNYN